MEGKANKVGRKKSRYQMINRGRKGKPCWYVEDFKDVDGGVGKYLYSNHSKSIAEGFLKTLRRLEKENPDN